MRLHGYLHAGCSQSRCQLDLAAAPPQASNNNNKNNYSNNIRNQFSA